MANLIKSAAEKLTIFDLFSSPVLMRYRNNQSVSSKTGGGISILIIAALIGFFSNSCAQMLSKTKVKAEYEVTQDVEPLPVSITKQSFFFAFELRGFSPFNPMQPRFLDISVTKEKIQNGIPQIQVVEMKRCEKSDISPFGKEYEVIFDRLGLANFMCLPKNFNLTIQGKWTSPIFSYLKVHIKRCNSIDPFCLNEALLDEYLANYAVFFVNYHFINKLINPSLLQPITTYYEDRAYQIMNKVLGQDASMMISDYIVNTDEALLPIKQINTTKGIYFEKNDKEQFFVQTSNQTFSTFFIKKSGKKIQINRRFTKFDEFLSYIGGLFGIIATIFGILLSKYNAYCFQIDMCSKVFKPDYGNSQKDTIQNLLHQNRSEKVDQINKSKEISFNFYIFLKYQVYSFIITICPKFKWNSMDQLHQQLEQTKNQMNFDTLLQKISFYERSFQCLFDQKQIMLLLLQNRLSIKQLKQQRMLMNFQENQFTRNILIQTLKQSIPLSALAKNKDSLNRTFSPDFQSQIFKNQEKKPLQVSMNAINMTFNRDNLEENQIQDETAGQLYYAIKQMIQKSKKGNILCERIYTGLREDILQWYKNYSIGRNLQMNQSDFIPVELISDQQILQKQKKRNKQSQA